MSSQTYVKPYLRYQGNKFKLLPFLKAHIDFDPKKQTWVEPFLGSGAVAFNFRPKFAVLSDINPYIISTLHYIQSSNNVLVLIKQLEKSLEELELQGEEFYYKMRALLNGRPIICASQFLFLNAACFNGLCRYNSHGEFNAAYCKSSERVKKALPLIAESLQAVHELMNSGTWNLYSLDFKGLFKTVNLEQLKSPVTYFDPPYHNRNVGYYTKWTRQDTLDLIKLMETLPGEVYLSSCIDDKSESILDLLPFKYKMWQTNHRYIIGAKANTRHQVAEVLIKRV